MVKQYILIIALLASSSLVYSQNGKDSLPPVTDQSLDIDDVDLEALLTEFELFLDSILAPRSYFLTNLSVGSAYFNFTRQNNTGISIKRKNIWSPAVGYYHKSGFGLSLTGNMVHDEDQLNLYQYFVSPSYDYIKDRQMAAGLAYSRYFTKDKLPFYTSPLQNEVYGYFLWRKTWLQPGLTATYGWGSRTDYEERAVIYRRLVANAANTSRLRDLIVTDTARIITRNTESIADFSLTGSVRHDFYWLNIFSQKDYIRFTPLFSVMAGTQRFGYNQAAATSGGGPRINLLYNGGSKNISLEDRFRLLSLSLYSRAEYVLGKFFFQPQLVLDYYLPAEKDNFSTLFSLNIGFTF